jgi:hypothetical protein
MQKHFREEMKLLIHGERLEGLMLGAGFIDVTVRKIKFEIGDWGSGINHKEKEFSL